MAKGQSNRNGVSASSLKQTPRTNSGSSKSSGNSGRGTVTTASLSTKKV